MCEKPKDPFAPELMCVIKSTTCRGRGDQTDPNRSVVLYHTTDGEFLAESDPCAVLVSPAEDLKRRSEESRRRALLSRAMSVVERVEELMEAWDKVPDSRGGRMPVYFQGRIVALRSALALYRERVNEQSPEEMEVEIKGFTGLR